jgi:tryptophan-rich sensory protein
MADFLHVKETNNVSKWAYATVVCFLAGSAAVATRMGVKSDWYVTVGRAPVVTPPAWVFQTVWAVLYVAIYWVLQRGRVSRARVIMALTLGTMWCYFFFVCRSAIAGQVVLQICWLLLLLLLLETHRHHTEPERWVVLMWFIWISFASALNLIAVSRS